MSESTAKNGVEVPVISPQALADRLASGNSPLIMDVRGAPEWTIEAPGIDLVQIPAEQARAEAAELAQRFDAPITVVCAKGKTARLVAAELRGAGADATVLEGGMSAWLQVLQDRDVTVELPGDSRVVQIQRPGRGCLSYLLASSGEAIVVDPAPDAEHYIALAAELDVRIVDVLDTHLHADHISGARELAQRTGARLRLPRAALDRGVAYEDTVVAVGDGDQITVGDLELKVLALPGHTTDMTGLLIADRVLIGGDSLFADGIARPDLQRGDPEGAKSMAKVLHRTIHERILSLGRDVNLLPGHTDPGVRAAAVAPTLGEVLADNPQLAIEDGDAFAAALLGGMPPRPENYETIMAVNAGEMASDPDLEAGGNSCSTGHADRGLS